MRQIGFSFLQNYKKEFGGSLSVGKRKSKRPLTTKRPIHLVLKSSNFSLFSPSASQIEKLIREDARKFKVKIYDISANWNHIHLLIQIPNREGYVRFIRSATSRLVYHLSSQMNQSMRGIFDLRPYTKILTWGRQFLRALDYLSFNNLESIGGKSLRLKYKRQCQILIMQGAGHGPGP